MNFCSQCGKPVVVAIPDGDNRSRHICPHCNTVHYQNPRMVVGCIPEYQGAILMCKRAIEPRYGYWTTPAGFLELDETLAEAAARETLEEAEATVELGQLITVVDVKQAGQVHIFFAASLPTAQYGAGAESLATRLFLPEEIPWEDIAFPSIRIALEHYLRCRKSGQWSLHLAAAPHLRLGSRDR